MIQLYRTCLLRGYLIFILLTVSVVAHATHIVGGELELRYLGAQGPYSHRMNLNLYFDDVNGSPGANDAQVTVGVFSKSSNAPVGYVTLPRVSDTFVPYTNSTCAVAYLRTRLIRYSTDVTLDPNVFNDPGGYYLSWERCCRNQTIINLINPGSAGSAFYLEFPALPTNGQASSYDSSPVFAVPKGDYACVGQPFTLDFSAKDPDGDSLTYTLVTPYNGFSTPGNPNPGAISSTLPTLSPTLNPGPYPAVTWTSGISVQNEIPGSQPLRVDGRTGLLSVTPGQAGLFVFSVQVDEYRRGVRIGRVRRDYQVLVTDCAKNNPPRLLFRPDGQKTFYKQGTVLTIAEKDTNCLSLYLTDPDVGQQVTITNMSGSLPNLTLAPGTLLTRTGTDTLVAKFCFGRCVGSDGKPVTLLLRATDNGCPQGLSDTLRIQLRIIPSANNKPKAGTDLANNTGRVTIGQSLTFNAFGTDIDNDNIQIQAVGRGFTLASAGMSFGDKSGVGKVTSPFAWKPTCAQASQYVVDFIVTSTRCNTPLRDTVTVRLSAQGRPSDPPSVRTTLPGPVVNLTVTPNDSTGITQFTVLGDDPNRDTLALTAAGQGFDYRAVGMNFAGKNGPPTLSAPFTWKPTCDLLNGKTEATYVVKFVVDDHSCQPKHTDTTTVTFNLRDPSVSADITVPNVFTPNGDGKNDYFAVAGLPDNSCFEQFLSVEILNRWGRTVFTSSDPHFRWYGTDYPVGTYYYYIRTTKRTFKGPLTLIR